MTDSEYQRFVASVYAGRSIVGVDRQYARKLYTDIPFSAIEAKTGEGPTLEKTVVWATVIASPLLLVACFALAISAFGWWSLIVITACASAWLMNGAMSVRGGASGWPLTLMLAATLVAYALDVTPDRLVQLALLFVGSLWAQRMLYVASTWFLRLAVLRNHKAMDAFRDRLTIQHLDAAS
jgi:hypothetical protein